MHNFVVRTNESACRKSGRLGMEQVLYDNTQGESLMSYTKRRATMKWSDPYTRKIKYCSSTKLDENNNKFGK